MANYVVCEYNPRSPLGERCDPKTSSHRTPFQAQSVLAHCVLKSLITSSGLPLWAATRSV